MFRTQLVDCEALSGGQRAFYRVNSLWSVQIQLDFFDQFFYHLLKLTLAVKGAFFFLMNKSEDPFFLFLL